MGRERRILDALPSGGFMSALSIPQMGDSVFNVA